MLSLATGAGTRTGRVMPSRGSLVPSVGMSSQPRAVLYCGTTLLANPVGLLAYSTSPTAPWDAALTAKR